MRLIDADDFFNRMNNDTDLCAEMEFEGLKALKKYLDLQPTAYSVDKVVLELNELDVKAIKRYKNGNFGDYEGTDYYIKKSKAIEIVKQGGVSDDVCEWEMDNVGTSIGCRSDLHHTGYVNRTDCPYCGKKIKVVE